MASKAYMNWNDAAHSSILVAMVDVMKPSAGQWDKIVESTSKMGYSFTAHALRQHLQKLKRSQGNNDGASSAAGSAASTPAKRTRGGSSKGSATKGAGKKGFPIDLDAIEDDTDYEEEGTPSKKPKTKAGAGAIPFKKEPKVKKEFKSEETKPMVKKEEPAEPAQPQFMDPRPEWEV